MSRTQLRCGEHRGEVFKKIVERLD